MTNEWLEFKAYTDKPTYFSLGKRDFSYLGRFSLNTILALEGLGRILTIIARGYLFHDKDGNVLKDDAYSRIEYARNALCAWCITNEEVQLPQHIKEKLESMELNDVPYDVVSEVVCFCIANKRDNNDWVHLPSANFDCYYGNTNFSKKWLSKIPDTILEREVVSGVSRVKLKI